MPNTSRNGSDDVDVRARGSEWPGSIVGPSLAVVAIIALLGIIYLTAQLIGLTERAMVRGSESRLNTR